MIRELDGYRMTGSDHANGGSRANEVLQNYEAAWREFGRIGDNGHYHLMVSQDTKTARQNKSKAPWVDAWCGTLMNMWNLDFVRAHYPTQIQDLITEGPSGTLFVQTPPRPEVMGEKVISDDCDFGWTTVWASEMGGAPVLDGLLRHADRFMRPTRRSGSLYYPRNDQFEDAFGVPPVDATLSLIDDAGRIVDGMSFRGRYTLIFFGFTHCRVVCPRALGTLTRVLDRLGTLASNARPLYITVDPERDTPEVLRAFLREQYPPFIGVTGWREQIDNAKRACRVFAQGRDEGAGDYLIPHTAITYVRRRAKGLGSRRKL